MTMTLGKIINLTNPLSSLVSKNLPAKYAYRLKKYIKDTEGATNVFEEQRKELFDKYVQKGDDGSYAINQEEQKYIFISSEDEEKFINEINEMLAEQIEINFLPIPVSNCPNLEISASELLILEDFFEE